MIHGKYYDLTDFKHPGGHIPIGLVEGRDGTELFETHHIFTDKDIPDIMSRYEIPKPKKTIKESGVYDWKATLADPFTKEIKEMARKVLGKDIKSPKWRHYQVVFFLLVAVWQAYVLLFEGAWYAMIAMPIAMWMFGSNVFHEASHFAMSWNPIWNQIGLEAGFNFMLPYVWYHHHVIGHHNYPNIKGMDPDLYHGPVIVRNSTDTKHRVQHKLQSVTFMLMWIINVPFGFLTKGFFEAYKQESLRGVIPFANNANLNIKDLVPR